MVLESLTTPIKAEKRPWDLLFIGIIYAAVGLFLAIWVFREEASIVMVLLTVIACIPLIYNTIKYEEEKDTVILKERTLLKEHGKALSFFVFLFIGFVIAFSLAYIFLPTSLVEIVFRTQTTTIQNINSQVSGKAIDAQASGSSALWLQIFMNNVKVLLFCIFFAFFYGAGSIFILAWNASVISAAIGSFFREHISVYAGQLGLVKTAGYFHIYSLSLFRYFLHGIPEILAYFIGGLAGGIISVAVIKHEFGTQVFKRILFDSTNLVLIAVIVLVVAASLEVYVTPLFF
ncbi:MAG: stage II sporulation protein M [Nanoarchaeota archaeon]